MSIDIESLRGLPVSDKLRLVTQLWDDIAESEKPIAVPADVLSEVTRRSAELSANPEMALDEEESVSYTHLTLPTKLSV